MKVTDEQIVDACAHHNSMSEAANSLMIHLSSLKERAIKLGVYVPNQGKKGSKKQKSKNGGICLNDILSGKHPTYQTHKLRVRLFNEGIKERKCELCGTSHWNGEQLSLILDHINGINDDHRLENLRIVCPNCDSLLPTFCGRNKKLKNGTRSGT